MEFATARGARREQRLVELDRGGDHKRGIPVLRGKTTCNSLLPGVQIRVVLDYRILQLAFQRTHCRPEDFGSLLDDAGKRDDVDDSP